MALSSPAELKARGIFTPDTLAESLDDEIPFVINGLFTEASINILAGDSGIGKTPLCLAISLAVAGGTAFMGMKVQRPRRVLYCDAESTRVGFHKTLATMSTFMGFKTIPKNFHVWSPNWDSSTHSTDFGGNLFARATWNGFQPEFIVVDPLRVFFPEADLKRDMAMRYLQRMRQHKGTWLIVHHTRKPNLKEESKPPKIEDDPHRWFHEVAGQHALINHVDTRLGVQTTPESPSSEMTMGGFVRMLGPINPVYLARKYDAQGQPKGYVRASSLDLLAANHVKAFHLLPSAGTVFTFKDARNALGKSDSAAANFLRRLQAIGAVTLVQGVGYTKTHN